MKKERRSFSPEDRLAIVQEGQREGTTATCRKYNLSPSLFAKWRSKYLAKGFEGLKPAYPRVDPAVRAWKRRMNVSNASLPDKRWRLSLNQSF
jgi:putative transposase